MADDAPLEHSQLSRSALQRPRHALRRTILITGAALAVLLGITVIFRIVNPISPIGVAEMLGAPSITHSWQPLGTMSADLPLAVIASEDGRFCNHWGVDWVAVRDAIKEGGGIGPGLRGASTIPMQLAKNLYLWSERSYLRKTLEMPLAYIISALWRKQELMETYLNIAPWGPVVGAEEASQYYFQKSAADLTRQEAILLAVALPNPSGRNPANPSPRTLRIAQAVEKRMPMLASRSACVLTKPDVGSKPASWP